MPKYLTLTSLLAIGAPAACDTETEVVDTQVFEACVEQEFTITAPSPQLPWTPLAIELVSEKLNDGVYVFYDNNAASYEPQGLPLATSGGFVIGDDGVLLIETMINRQLFCQVVDLIRAETDKPVLYAINTSGHGDHSYGNMFLPPEVKIVQHERTAAFIAEHFAEDLAFMKANFGEDQGLEELVATPADIEVSNAGWSIDLGGIEVEANYHGFGQTEGDLFVYLPEEKVLWTGNPVVGTAPVIPWLLDGRTQDAKATLDAVQETLAADAIVVPGHGSPMSRAGLDFTRSYLDTLIRETQQAIDAGKSLDETVAAVTMEAFQGYALWDWVHSQVNVPATYADLSN